MKVVYIFKHKNNRAAIGHLKVMADGNHNWALFSPADSRMPRMMVPADQLPAGFFERSYEFSRFLYIAQIVEWPATAQFARGRLIKQIIGTEHDAETEALILAARGISPPPPFTNTAIETNNYLTKVNGGVDKEIVMKEEIASN